jgi:uncharacterized repeat protein (TIGR02543 family)
MKVTANLMITFILLGALAFIPSACNGGGNGAFGSSGTFTITYNGNGNTRGSIPVDSNEYVQGQVVSVLGNPGNLACNNYSFAGWNTQADGSGTTYSQTQTFIMGQSNVTLYAIWTASPTYTVTYSGNGNTSGSVPSDTTNYEQGQTVMVLGNTGNLANFGYSFTGWNTRANGSGMAFTQAQTLIMGQSNVTLYAMWTASPTYTVTYSGNGNTSGSVPSDTTNYEQGQTVTVLGNTGNLAYTGFIFAGWNTQVDGSGTAYAQAQTFTMGSSNVTLYAMWSTALPTPTNVQAIAGNAQVSLNWTASSGATSYDVYYSLSSNISVTSYSYFITSAATSTVVSGLENGATYYFIVTARYGTVTSNASIAVSVTPLELVSPGQWTWISGADIINQSGIYGLMGTAAASNIPGARSSATSWADKSGNLWLFGGSGYDSTGTYGLQLNDFWKFDGANWTWMGGSNVTGQNGIYGTKGTGVPATIPGARNSAVSWIDNSGNFWLFGGYGLGSPGSSSGNLNDLWKFDGTYWIWISGSATANQGGIYGTIGIAVPSNIPGARNGAVSWIDNSGNLWLFGGSGYDSQNTFFYLNDLWKFDGTNWTWVSGNNLAGQSGNYGMNGTASLSNVPGSRTSAVSWIDGNGNLWLFGGYGFDSTGTTGYLNDLWKFDGTNWTWAGGSSIADQIGIYGTKNIAAGANIPGARISAVSWTDKSGNFWLFGGFGYDSTVAYGDLNDLWKFDGANWTWVSGSNHIGQSGIYGTKGTAGLSNIPGGRVTSVSWTDKNGNFWLFGGMGFDSTGAMNTLGDLWQYQP